MPVTGEAELSKWKEFLRKFKNPVTEIDIALVGKYVELKDSYKSINEALIHAGSANECRVNLRWIHSEEVQDASNDRLFRGVRGMLVAPGFGDRGIEGKIRAIQYSREQQLPFFGICLGMQCAVIEFGRNVLGFRDAHSTEFDAKTTHPVIALLDSQKSVINKGGTMRLGSYRCQLKPGTKAYATYIEDEVRERHRHRYEFNNEYLIRYESQGMIASGINPDGNLVEIIELKDHPWFVGVQFHPEYRSTVLHPHPLFLSFVKAAIELGEMEVLAEK
jgi:CTP synthase